MFPDAGIGAGLPGDLAEFVNDYYREKGVEVLPEREGGGVGREGGGFASSSRAARDRGRRRRRGPRDHPAHRARRGERAPGRRRHRSSTSTAASIGHEDVFAAGDVARFPARARRHAAGRARGPREHRTAARRREHGRRGHALRLPPVLLLRPLRPRLRGGRRRRRPARTVEEWAEPNRKGVVCYVEDGKPRGFLLWDVWDKVDPARELILAGEPVDAAALAPCWTDRRGAAATRTGVDSGDPLSPGTQASAFGAIGRPR